MFQIYYWSPCLTKIGTYKSTINSAISLAKYSKDLVSVKVINICGEWDSEIDFLKKNNVGIINLGLKYFNFLPKTGYIKTRFSYLVIIFFSIIPLIKLLLKKKPDFLLVHLLTILPLTISNILNLKTKIILRISGFPKLNILRHYLWKKSSKKIFKVFCPSIDLKKQLLQKKIFPSEKLIFLPDPIIKVNNFKNKNYNYQNVIKKKYFISVGRLTKQKNFKYLINEFSIFAENNLEYDLYIFGDGEEKERLNNQINKNKMQNRIFLMGHNDDIYFFMKNAEAFILTSLWEDPGFVLVEAAYNNLFIISSDCKNGPKEILDNGKRGLLFNNKKKSALVDSLYEYLKIKKEKRTKPFLILAKKYCKKYTLFQHFKILKTALTFSI